MYNKDYIYIIYCFAQFMLFTLWSSYHSECIVVLVTGAHKSTYYNTGVSGVKFKCSMQMLGLFFSAD